MLEMRVLPLLLLVVVRTPALLAQEACLKATLLPPDPGVASSVMWDLRVTSDGRLCASRPVVGAPSQDDVDEAGSGRAFLYSTLVPGAGQKLLGQDRWAPYLALEAWAWVRYADQRRNGADLRRQYRDLAWQVARRFSSGARVDGDFEYYEALTRFRSSGAFDADPLRPGVQPETDPTTFNGSIWRLASQIFLQPASDSPPDEDSPEYARALEFYMGRSYPAQFAWDWGENGLQQTAFRNLIRGSDEKLRRSTAMIGLIIANHLLSAVDALISTRLRGQSGEPPLELRAFPDPAGLGWTLGARLLR